MPLDSETALDLQRLDDAVWGLCRRVGSRSQGVYGLAMARVYLPLPCWPK